MKSSKSKPAPKHTTPLTLLSLFPEYRKKAYRIEVAKLKAEYVETLRDCYNRRGLVLYIGAGVSQSMDLPSWNELLRLLTTRMMARRVSTAVEALKGLKEEARWGAIASLQEQVAEEAGEAEFDKPKLMLARSIKDAFGDRLGLMVARDMYRRSKLISFYRRRMRSDEFNVSRGGRPEREAMPSSMLLDAIVALARPEREVKGVHAIINYNYDNLLDEKLREESIRCVTVLSGKGGVPSGSLPCYHVHGVLPVAEYLKSMTSFKKNPFVGEAIGNFVFSEDEYHLEYSDPYRWSNITQVAMLSRYTGLFVGLSMEDPNIRRLIDVVHSQYPDSRNFAILPRKKSLVANKDSKQSVVRNLFESVETKSFDQIGMRIIWVDSFGEIPVILRSIGVPQA
jgi:hypothetical protein